MKFKKALKAMKEGKTVSRHGLDQFHARLDRPDDPCFCRIIWYRGSRANAGFVSLSDYEAKDWYIVEEA